VTPLRYVIAVGMTLYISVTEEMNEKVKIVA
jgi:hypothetical protein